MSVAVEHRTVSLWPLNASPLGSRSGRPYQAAVVQQTAQPPDPATEALAAITSSYRHGRAGIISGAASSSAGQLGESSPSDNGRPTHSPTVPLTFLPRPRPAEAPGPPPENTTFWSRLVGTRGPARRGRHSPKG
jgi:hypothetical protein